MTQATSGLHESLARHTSFLITRVGMAAHKRFAERLEELEVTPRMWGALSVLDAEGTLTQGKLCKLVGMDASSMVSTIDELEAMGLVQRRAHPSDRRAHALHITPAGRTTLGRGRELAQVAQQELLASLTEDERAQLHRLLLRLTP